ELVVLCFQKLCFWIEIWSCPLVHVLTFCHRLLFFGHDCCMIRSDMTCVGIGVFRVNEDTKNIRRTKCVCDGFQANKITAVGICRHWNGCGIRAKLTGTRM
ncbi:unnamed protein product, partial [Pylaiella littoralis]